MKQIKIIKDNVITNSAKFETEEECNTWLNGQEAIDAFQGIYWKQESEFTTETKDASLETRIVTNEDSTVSTSYKFRNYTVEISDYNDYKEKRAAAYPDFRELLDAFVKKTSSDSAIVTEGIAQEAKYYADCLAVKALYPKE